MILLRRDDRFDDWDNHTSLIVKWAITGGILLALLAYFVVGYMHAKSRLEKGLQPLPYHRWLVRRHQRPDLVLVTYHPDQYNNAVQGNGQQNYAEPLPKYEPPRDAPPQYYGPPTDQPPVSAPAQLHINSSNSNFNYNQSSGHIPPLDHKSG